jgi:hypothetical protein
MIKTQPVTGIDLLTETQPSTTPHPFHDLESLDTSTVPTFTELLAKYNASLSKPEGALNHLISDESTDPFAIYQNNLANVRPQPVRWLWQNRLPLAGITLLDGDHGCGKSLLALQIAAHVSSGEPMPDGTPTLQGGVIIITPHTNAATTQLQLLTSFGADLSRIEILSYIPEPDEDATTSSYRPFSLPEDMDRLLEAIKRVDARLVMLDPFTSLLSHQHRWTEQRIHHLLSNLNQRLIECNVACLVTRNCHAKGGHARPSLLERSEHFSTIAVSRLLLAPDPMQPDYLLLCHALNRHTALTPTLTLQIQTTPEKSNYPHIIIRGTHSLTSRDLIECRPDTLHRRLLSQHLLCIISATTDPIPVATLYAKFPHSSPFQIQRSLSDLLRMGQIERPARGFYAPASPTFALDVTATTTPNTSPANRLTETAAKPPANNSNEGATTTSSTSPVNNLDGTAAKSLANNSNEGATTTSSTSLANNLTETAAKSSANNSNEGAATTSSTSLANNLTETAAKSPASISNGTATMTHPPSLANNLTETAAKSPASISNGTATITLKPAATAPNLKPQHPHKGRGKHKNTKKRR